MPSRNLTDAELTRLAAEMVMGWTVSEFGCFRSADGSMMGLPANWNPLTDWRAAGEIVDKMRADGWHLILTNDEKHHVAKFLKIYGWGDADAENGPRAITIAALRAVGVEL